MCPKIEVSNEVFSQLESLAIGFDSPSNVIGRLISFYEKHGHESDIRSNQRQSSKPRKFTNREIQRRVSDVAKNLSEEELNKFTTYEYSNDVFGLSFPLFVTIAKTASDLEKRYAVTDKGVPRWSWKFEFERGDKLFAICTQWYAKHDNLVEKWLLAQE